MPKREPKREPAKIRIQDHLHDVGPGDHVVEVAPLLAQTLEDFEQFLKSEDTPAELFPLRQELLALLDEHPNVFQALYASGFMAGIHTIIDGLIQTQAHREMEEQLLHTPKKNIPRA